MLTGKVGNPPKPVGFMATGINWGIRLNWGFPANTGDTLKTEIQYTSNSDFSDPLLLSDVPYPSAEYTQLGLRAGQEFWYRAQLVDKTGNESGYTDWIRGLSNDNADDYLGDIADDFLSSADGDRLTSDIDTDLEAALQNALANNATVDHQWAQYGEVRAQILVVRTTIVAFVHCTVEVEITQTISGNTITVDFLRPNATGTAYVYFFSIFPQTKPDYGLAVWDASGTLILTNETRTLSDVVTLGNAGVDASSGYNINTTLAGKWACMPAMLGLITGVISAGGQPQPYLAIYKSMAKPEGSNTRIFARPQTTPSGNLQNVAYSNLRNVIMAINCANYD